MPSFFLLNEFANYSGKSLHFKSAPDLPLSEGIILRIEGHFPQVLKILGHTTLTGERAKSSARAKNECK